MADNRTTKHEKRRRLYETGSAQAGYFSAAQARAAGYSAHAVLYHVATGTFERVSRGFYRLRDFPSSSHEDVIAASVKAGRAVVSHETALSLYDLSTVRPRKIDLTVPRALRPPGNRPGWPSVRIHTTTRVFGRGEVVRRFGVRITSPARTIIDTAEAGTDPEYIVDAVANALERGLVKDEDLKRAAQDRPTRVTRLIERAIEAARRGAAVR